MSEAEPTSSKTEEKKSSTVAPVKDAKAKPKRKWRRRIIITVIVLLALVVIARLSVSILLPPVLNKVAGIYGLTAKYDRLELYAGGGDIGLWNLRFTPKNGGEPILQTAYCRGAVSLWGLMQGKLRVKRVEAEDATLLIERAEDGSLPALEQLLKENAQATKPASAKEPSDRALTLDPPLKIDVLRLQNARARVRDLSQQPAVDASLDMDLLVTDVGSLDKQTRVEMQVHSPEALGAFYVSVVGDSRDNKLQAELTMTLFGLNLEPAKPYLAPLGIVPIAGNISGKASGKLEATLVPIGPASADGKPAPTALAAKLTLNDMDLTADSQTTASVKSVVVDVSSFTPDAVRIADISVSGVRANAARNASGNLQFAGIELVPVEGASAPMDAPAPPAAASATSRPADGGTAPIFELKTLSIDDAVFTFDDSATPEPTQLGLQLSKMQVQHVSTDPAQADQPITIAVDASAPGLVKTLNLAGEAALATDIKTFDLAFTGTGVNPEAAAPYLQMLGLKSQITDGAMKGRLIGSMQTLEDGTLTASTTVRDITVTDQNRTLFAMPLVDLKDVKIAPDGSRIAVASIAMEGPVVPIERNADGVVSVLGVQFVGGAAPGKVAPATTQQTSGAAAAAPATQPAAPLKLPTVEIQQFTWNGANISLDDRMNEQAVDLALSDVSVEVKNLLLDPNAADGTPGTLVMKVRSPGVVEQFDLNGKITPSPQKLTVELLGNAAGITAEAFKPLLSEIGIEPVMKDGDLQFLVLGTLATTDDGVSADLSVSDVQLTDGDTQWLGLEDLSIRQAAIGASGLSVDAIEMTDASALVQRDEEGLVSAAGFRMLPAKPVAPVAAAAPIANEAPTAAPAPVANASTRLRLLKVNNASLRVQDAYVLPAADVSVKVNAEVKDVILGKDAAPATFNALVSSPDVVDSLKTAGAFMIGDEAQRVDLQVSASGIHGKAIESYLPPNATTHFNNGEFAAVVAASVEKNDEGGVSAKLDVRDVRLFDGVASDPVLGVNAVRVNVDRLDMAGKRIAVKEITVEGAQLAVTQDEGGTRVAGLTLAPAPVRPVRQDKPAPEPVASEQGSNVEALIQQRQEKAPLITLDTLSIQADRLSYASTALAEPVSIVGLSLKNVSPIELLGDDPAARPPVDLQLRGGVENLIDSIAADAHLAPLAAEPLAKVNVDINGIHANELTKLIPDLAGKVDGSGLSDGRFTTSAEAHFAYTRRGSTGIDMTRDITADVAVLNTRLTQNGVEQPLAGLDEFRGERIRYSPASGAVTIQSIEIVKPAARILRDAQGIHAFGFTVVTPPEGASEANATTNAEPVDAASAVAVDSNAGDDAAVPAAPGAEMRIDQLIVSGADIVIEDRLGEVPTVIPINALDVEVKGLSNRAMVEPRPVRFSAIVGAGKVPLSQPNGQISERPVFAEASASGNLVFVPQLKGYAKTSLSGLEMTALTGLASQAGIKINGGTFDVRTDVRMQGDDAMVARVYPTFNELRVTEPPGGPVQRILQLPAPLDVVISTLEAADGSISIPVEVPMKAGELNTGAVIGSAVASIARVTAEAMVAAPLKAAKLVAMLGGADVSSARTRGLEPVVIRFTPGESQLTGEQREALGGVIDQLKRDGTIQVTIQHTLGAEDVTLAEARSNPATDDSLALASRLRQRKLEQQREQARQISQVRVLLASQNTVASEAAIEQLRSTSIALKETEDGLNQLLELLRPGADRQTERRTKAASILLGDLRLRAVQQMLLDSNVSSVSERVRKANALFNPAEDPAQPGEVTLVLVRAAK